MDAQRIPVEYLRCRFIDALWRAASEKQPGPLKILKGLHNKRRIMWSRWHPRIGRLASIVGAAKRLALMRHFPSGFSCGAKCRQCGRAVRRLLAGIHVFGLPMCALCVPFQHAVIVNLCSVYEAETGIRCRSRGPLYDDASREIILRFKHADRTRYANAIGAWIIRAGAIGGRRVPVLLYPRRLIGRRYNQSLLLARAVACSDVFSSYPMLCAGTEIRQVRATGVGPGTGTFRARSPCVDPPKPGESRSC